MLKFVPVHHIVPLWSGKSSCTETRILSTGWFVMALNLCEIWCFLDLNLRNIFMALNLWEIWCFLRRWIFVKSDAFFGFESLINLLFMALNLWEIYFLWLWIFEKSSFYGFESLRNLLFMALILWEIYQSWSKLFSALRASSLLNLVAWNINDNQLWFTIIDHIVAHCCYLDFDDRHRNPNPNQSHILLGV